VGVPGQAWIFRPATQPPGCVIRLAELRVLPYRYGSIWVAGRTIPAGPMLGGQMVFGDPGLFSVGLLLGTPASIDGWLGLSPGTTVYGAGSGRVWGVAGTLWDSSEAAVLADFAVLAALCDGSARGFILPSGEKRPMLAWAVRPSARVMPGELVADPNGPQPPGAAWSLRYWCAVRDPQF